MTPPDQKPLPDDDTPDDSDLMDRIATQDRNAFILLYERYARRIKLFLIRRGLGESDADEVTQEVLAQVWHRASSFDASKASVSTWVFTIARNRRIDLLRKFTRPEPDPNDPHFQPDPEPPALDVLAAEDRQVQIREALSKLNKDQLVIIRASFYDGLSQSEIAEMLGLPLGTVKSRMRLAFNSLRKNIGEGALEDLLD
jgi:RNA polymerase sigma-70 factor (ECF subfamily)